MIITLFKSEWDAYTTDDQVIDGDWDSIATALMFFHQRRKKEDAPMFNLWEFDPDGEPGRKYINKEKTQWNELPGTVRRCADNALGVWGLVLDCDAQLTMEEAIESVAGLDYVLYSSFRHSSVQDKFRIVLPFTRMMTRIEFEAKREDIKKCFPLVDNASFSRSQAIFLHSGANPSIAIAMRGHGAKINPDDFITSVRPVTAPSTYVPTGPVNQTAVYADTCAVLDELRKHYHELPYAERFTVTRAVLGSIGPAAVNEMRNRWPDQNLNGKYEAMILAAAPSRPVTIGSLVEMIRQHDPQYRKTPKYKDIEFLKSRLAQLDK